MEAMRTPYPSEHEQQDILNPRFIKNNHSSQRKGNEQSLDNCSSIHENKLPVNLFHSAAQYNKMLITNGKCVKKAPEPQIEGFLDSLQFINDPIFQTCQQKRRRSSLRRSTPAHGSDRKQIHSFTNQCICCANETCGICSSKPASKVQKSYRTPKNLRQKKRSKSCKKNNRRVVSNSVNIKHKDAVISNSFMTNSYLSPKKFHIDDLVCQSLLLFEEQRRQKRINELREMQRSRDQIKAMKMYGEEVREANKGAFYKLGGSPKARSLPSKSLRRFKYWEQIKGLVSHELRKDQVEGYSKNIIDLLKKSTKTETKCNHSPQISSQLMEFFRKKHEIEALDKIAFQKMKKQEKKKKISQSLGKLKKWQKRLLYSCRKQKFQPTKAMIDNAFANLCQEQVPVQKIKREKRK